MGRLNCPISPYLFVERTAEFSKIKLPSFVAAYRVKEREKGAVDRGTRWGRPGNGDHLGLLRENEAVQDG